MNNQQFIYSYDEISNIIDLEQNNNIFIVCDKFLMDSFIINYLKKISRNIFIFTEFNPNPKYEDVLLGIDLFKKNNCNFIISIGGGSAIDVAKCIKAFVTLNDKKNYLEQEIIKNDINHLAIPTTAGTGSESTHFAVIYYEENKYSVDDSTLLPTYVLLESKFLESLPIYQKKSTMLDALCQGIESLWSVNSTEESKEYATKAIQLILNNYKDYINENKSVYNDIMLAANYSGRAINISKTTAPHAMSYKITSLYGISHGHAVALCLPYVWEYMINNIDKIIDKRGVKYLKDIFNRLDILFNCDSHIESINKFKNICSEINLNIKGIVKRKDLQLLVSSVNIQRLSNNPVSLNKEEIKKIYEKLA